MERLFFIVMKMSLVSLYCIGFVLFARLLLKKAPKIYSYLLWMIVFIRLICPVVLESPVSLVPSAVTEMERTFDTEPQAGLGNREGQTAFRGQGQEQGNAVPYEEQVLEGKDYAKKGSDTNTNLNPGKWGALGRIGAGIWILGMLSLIVYFGWSLIGMKRKLAGSKKLSEALYERRNGECTSLYVSEQIETAFVFGFIKPAIYLPEGMKQEEMKYVIRHEQIHVRRWDYRIKIAAFLIVCVHWFNPFVWLAYLLMGRDMEMSCDERVLKEMGAEIKKAYSIEGSYFYYGEEQQFFAEGVANQLALGNQQEMYSPYLEPDTSAVAMLYLSDGNAEVKERQEEEALVSYTFSDGSIIEIPMYRIENLVQLTEEESNGEAQSGRMISLWAPWKQKTLNADSGQEQEFIVSMARDVKFKEGAFD